MSINGVGITPPDLSTLLDRLKTNIFQTLHSVKIGRIESFDAVKRTAEIKLVFRIPLAVPVVGSNGESIVSMDYPLLVDCPVVTLQGGGGVLTFPVAAGDECLVFFSDSNIDAWYAQGCAKTTLPYDGRKHDIADGVALVGLNSLPRAIAPEVTASETALTYSGAKIAEKNGKITLSNATQNFITVMDPFLTAIGADAKLDAATKSAALTAMAALDALFY